MFPERTYEVYCNVLSPDGVIVTLGVTAEALQDEFGKKSSFAQKHGYYLRIVLAGEKETEIFGDQIKLLKKIKLR